jgi:hypothetical protein
MQENEEDLKPFDELDEFPKFENLECPGKITLSM